MVLHRKAYQAFRPPEMSSVIHTLTGIRPSDGGVARSVPTLCESEGSAGWSVHLLSQLPQRSDRSHLRLPSDPPVTSHLVCGFDWPTFRFSFTPGLYRYLSHLAKSTGCSILHDHGMWLQMNHVSAQVAWDLGIKRVVSPRGTLESWSLGHHSIRKRLAWTAFQRRDLLRASGFCVTSHEERQSLIDLGFSQPIAVIPNGINMPLKPRLHQPSRRIRTVGFLSRLHPKKGVSDLLSAWAHVAAKDWRLVIAGPSEGSYDKTLKQEARTHKLGASVEFLPNLNDVEKDEFFQSVDVFVLPSYSENFGIVVGEALSYGIPVITTTGTPWSSLVRIRAGWRIEPTVSALYQALAAAMTIDDEERSCMGARGRSFVAENFSWESVGRQHLDFYRTV